MYILPHTHKETSQHSESGPQRRSNKHLLNLPRSAISPDPRMPQHPQLSPSAERLLAPCGCLKSCSLKHYDVCYFPTRDPDSSSAKCFVHTCPPRPFSPSHLSSASGPIPLTTRVVERARDTGSPFLSCSRAITYVKHLIPHLAPQPGAPYKSAVFSTKLPQGPEVRSNHQSRKWLEQGWYGGVGGDNTGHGCPQKSERLCEDPAKPQQWGW